MKVVVAFIAKQPDRDRSESARVAVNSVVGEPEQVGTSLPVHHRVPQTCRSREVVFETEHVIVGAAIEPVVAVRGL